MIYVFEYITDNYDDGKNRITAVTSQLGTATLVQVNTQNKENSGFLAPLDVLNPSAAAAGGSSGPGTNLFGFLNNNPLMDLAKGLFGALGANGNLGIGLGQNKNRDLELKVDRSLGVLGLNGRDTDQVQLTATGPAYKNTKSIDVLGTEIGRLDLDRQLAASDGGSLDTNDCTEVTLLGGNIRRCEQNKVNLNGVAKFFQDAFDAVSFLSSKRR